MSRRPRRNHTPAFKAKVSLAAIKGEKTLAELARPPRGGVDRNWAIIQQLGADAVLALARCPRDRITMPDRKTGGRAPHEDEGDAITLTIEATLKRVGMEMRHMVEAPRDRNVRKPDRSLLRLLARAHRFRDLILRGDGRSIAELAEENGVTRPYFSRIVRLGFLAPDITAAILDGRQPIALSAKQMSITADLARDWSEQRCELGFG